MSSTNQFCGICLNRHANLCMQPIIATPITGTYVEPTKRLQVNNTQEINPTVTSMKDKDKE